MPAVGRKDHRGAPVAASSASSLRPDAGPAPMKSVPFATAGEQMKQPTFGRVQRTAPVAESSATSWYGTTYTVCPTTVGEPGKMPWTIDTDCCHSGSPEEASSAVTTAELE